jgi:competence protein ComEA
VQEALAAAGGALPEADLAAVNLAAGVQSGDRIDVPVIPPTPAPTRRATAQPTPPPGEPGPGATPIPRPQGGDAPAVVSGPVEAGKININTATAAEFERLPKIGPSIAQRIVEYRDAHGPFARIEDLQRVKGIGPATFEALKDSVTVGP